MFYATTPEHEALRKKVREWVETEIKPIAFQLDQKNEFPHEQIAEFSKIGYIILVFRTANTSYTRFSSVVVNVNVGTCA